MGSTTISIDPAVRDRLKTFCGGGMSYSETLSLVLDRIEREDFFAQLRRDADDPDYPWLDELEWD